MVNKCLIVPSRRFALRRSADEQPDAAVTVMLCCRGRQIKTAKPPGLGRYRRLCLRPPYSCRRLRYDIRWASELKRSPPKQQRGKLPARPANHICRIRQTVTGNMAMLRKSEFSTRDFAVRSACGLRHRHAGKLESGSMCSQSVVTIEIVSSSDKSLLTKQYALLVI
jgi:hypothetical protein